MSEQTIFGEILDRYRDQGYEVKVEPGLAELPPYLADARIDAIATKGTQVVLFQAKGHAEDERPGILITDQPDVAYAQSLLSEVELLLSADTARAALLTAWAAAEATMRMIARKERIESDRLTPSGLLEQLQDRQLISLEEYLAMQYCLTLQNAVSHGFQPIDPHEDAVALLISLSRRLLDPMSGRGDSRKSGALLSSISGGLKNLDEVRRIIKDAVDVLEGIIGNAAGIVAAEWEKAEDALGRPVVTLRLSDLTGKVTATFDPKELQDPDHLRLRLRRLWGDLLQIRSQKKREELMKLLGRKEQ